MAKNPEYNRESEYAEKSKSYRGFSKSLLAICRALAAADIGFTHKVAVKTVVNSATLRKRYILRDKKKGPAPYGIHPSIKKLPDDVFLSLKIAELSKLSMARWKKFEEEYEATLEDAI